MASSRSYLISTRIVLVCLSSSFSLPADIDFAADRSIGAEKSASRYERLLAVATPLRLAIRLRKHLRRMLGRPLRVYKRFVVDDSLFIENL